MTRQLTAMWLWRPNRVAAGLDMPVDTVITKLDELCCFLSDEPQVCMSNAGAAYYTHTLHPVDHVFCAKLSLRACLNSYQFMIAILKYTIQISVASMTSLQTLYLTQNIFSWS